MRYWWVNQNQTWRQEQAVGYLWSPKRNTKGARNHFYETMREVAPGDGVFSFFDTFITAIGIVQSYCWESPKPAEFGGAGSYWADVGWKVRVLNTPLSNQVRPKDHIEILRPLQPERYAPLQASGNGNQGLYLTELMPAFAEALVALGVEAEAVRRAVSLDEAMQTGDDLDYWEHKIEEVIQDDRTLVETEKTAIIRARRGQGLFADHVIDLGPEGGHEGGQIVVTGTPEQVAACKRLTPADSSRVISAEVDCSGNEPRSET